MGSCISESTAEASEAGSTTAQFKVTRLIQYQLASREAQVNLVTFVTVTLLLCNCCQLHSLVADSETRESESDRNP